MRIISKFHDYYDSVLKFGADNRVVYVREAAEVDLRNGLPEDLSFMEPSLHARDLRTQHDASLLLQPFIIAFCGRVYPGVRLISPGKPGKAPAFDESYYDAASYTARLTELGLKINPGRRSRWSLSCASPLKLCDIKDFYKTPAAPAFDALVSRRTPVLVGVATLRSPVSLELHQDCALKPFRFYQVFNAYSAFQELDMFLGGVLAQNEDPMPVLDDRAKVQRKGFDQYSFRRRAHDR